MGLIRRAVGALLALVVTAFVAYCILMPINDVLLSSPYQKFIGIFPFPFISQALDSGGGEEKAMSFLAEDRQYTAAVRHDLMPEGLIGERRHIKVQCNYCLRHMRQMFSGLQVYMMWGLTFLAALLTLLMRNSPSSHGKRKHDVAAAEPLFDAPKPFSKAYSVVSCSVRASCIAWACHMTAAWLYMSHGTLLKQSESPNIGRTSSSGSLFMQTRRILHYHLPPRGFWTWWCGGMAVYDALVVAAWIAINIIYTQQRVALILPLFKGACIVECGIALCSYECWSLKIPDVGRLQPCVRLG